MWDLGPGQEILRKTLHQRFGGQQQGGISPSAQSPNIFVFYDPETGEQHGYYDNWQADGCLHYTGEGQRGDQEMKSGMPPSITTKVMGGRCVFFEAHAGR